MKKLTVILTSIIFSTLVAGGASADYSVTPVQQNDEWAPYISVAEPNPIELSAITVFYAAPGGKSLGSLEPQVVRPTGNILGDWVQIYTWFGEAWINIPGYIPSY